MPRFFCTNISKDKAIIEGNDAHHISHSLRMKKGEEIIICDANGYDYKCITESFGDSVVCKIIEKYSSNTEPDIFVTLYQSIPKQDKMEMIIQKSVELGVSKIVPVLSKRCISRHDEKSMNKKLERYSKISKEAAKQSGRGIIPQIENMISYKEAVKISSKDDLSLICYEGGGKNLCEIDYNNIKTISIFVGGEGGFDIDEINLATKNDMIRIGLGPRILRCETAPLAALSILMNCTKNM